MSTVIIEPSDCGTFARMQCACGCDDVHLGAVNIHHGIGETIVVEGKALTIPMGDGDFHQKVEIEMFCRFGHRSLLRLDQISRNVIMDAVALQASAQCKPLAKV